MKYLIPSCILAVFFWFGCQGPTSPKNEPDAKIPNLPSQNLIKRGAYLVTISGCNDCHSPKKMGPNGPEIIKELMLSGYHGKQAAPNFDQVTGNPGFSMFVPDLTAAHGPWGTSFAANLTPDESGIGNWNLEQFKIALTQGKYKGMATGRPLLPPMPWPNYIHMDEEDISAIFAYLKSIPPVHNVVPAPIPPGKH